MGKTALATNIAYNIAKSWEHETGADGREKTTNGGIVGFFSLEMSAEQLATRIICGADRNSVEQNPPRCDRRIGIRRHQGRIDRSAKIAVLCRRNWRSFDRSTWPLGRGVSKGSAGSILLVIDYVQLLQGTSRRASENRVQEITEITTRLKALAKELNIPILALSQLSRQVEIRDDKRPQLSDLRESGSIEQDADVVMFVFREEYYHQMRKPSNRHCREIRRMAGGGRTGPRQGRT